MSNVALRMMGFGLRQEVPGSYGQRSTTMYSCSAIAGSIHPCLVQQGMCGFGQVC